MSASLLPGSSWRTPVRVGGSRWRGARREREKRQTEGRKTTTTIAPLLPALDLDTSLSLSLSLPPPSARCPSPPNLHSHPVLSSKTSSNINRQRRKAHRSRRRRLLRALGPPSPDPREGLDPGRRGPSRLPRQEGLRQGDGAHRHRAEVEVGGVEERRRGGPERGGVRGGGGEGGPGPPRARRGRRGRRGRGRGREGGDGPGGGRRWRERRRRRLRRWQRAALSANDCGGFGGGVPLRERRPFPSAAAAAVCVRAGLAAAGTGKREAPRRPGLLPAAAAFDEDHHGCRRRPQADLLQQGCVRSSLAFFVLLLCFVLDKWGGEGEGQRTKRKLKNDKKNSKKLH